MLCNTGSLFNARLNDQVYHFAAQGFYDAMSLIADEETQSYWNHITGVCLHGALTGTQLQRLAPLLQMTAADALAVYPEASLTSMRLSGDEMDEAQELNTVYHLPNKPEISNRLLATLSFVDTRLPRYDIGLGIWTSTTQRYYPISTLYKNHNVLFDEIDGRPVIVVLDVDVTLPIAFYMEAQQIEFHGDTLILGTDTTYRKGVLYEKGRPMPVERPNQNAIRWYGFCSLFPDCEIYGQNRL